VREETEVHLTLGVASHEWRATDEAADDVIEDAGDVETSEAHAMGIGHASRGLLELVA
jgi:hypothetical protein